MARIIVGALPKRVLMMGTVGRRSREQGKKIYPWRLRSRTLVRLVVSPLVALAPVWRHFLLALVLARELALDHVSTVGAAAGSLASPGRRIAAGCSVWLSQRWWDEGAGRACGVHAPRSSDHSADAFSGWPYKLAGRRLSPCKDDGCYWELRGG